MIKKILSTLTIKFLLVIIFLFSLSIYFIAINKSDTNLPSINNQDCEIEFFFSDQDIILYQVDQQTTLIWSF